MKSSDASASDERRITGRYVVIQTLAVSAHATILLARDEADQRDVVLKRFDASGKGAYLREAGAVIDNHHPNLLAPLDTFYLSDDSGCLVYEYFPEGTARQTFEPGRPLPLHQVVTCAEDCLRALAHLHQRKLIHCDIKPENIFVRREGTTMRFLLGDLGSTCALREATEGKHRTGSPAYAAPERLSDRFHFNSDLYSLGVVLFEAATGRLPFSGGPREVARAHVTEAVPLDQIHEGVLRDFIGGLMEKDPSRRVATAERALMLLASMSHPSMHESTARVVQARPTHPARQNAPQIVLGRRPPREITRTLVESGFQKLHVLGATNERPVLVIENASDLTFADTREGMRTRMVPKSGPMKVLGPSDVIYQVESSICRYDLRTHTRTVLHDRCTGAIDFACDGQRLLWRTRRSAHVLNLQTRDEVSLLAPHYLLDARSHLLPDGHFVLSSGPMNSHISLRTANGQQTRLTELDGPIIEIVNERTVLLVLSLNIKDQDNYAIWRVTEYAEAQKMDIPIESRVVTLTPGHIFWLVDREQIFQCGIGLASRPIFRSNEALDGFAVSPDHAWIATWRQVDEKNTRVRIYGSGTDLATERNSA